MLLGDMTGVMRESVRTGELQQPASAGPPGLQRDSHGKPILPIDDAKLYAFGNLIRSTEQLLLELFTRGQLSGTTHTCLGQELCQMSVVRALTDPDDTVLSNHRNHGHFLTYSGNFQGLISEIMGRETGVCRGIGGSQHLAFRHFHSNGVQGGMTAISVGLALARKRRTGRGIAACIIGDGTLGEGLTYESLNLASIWQVPLLFVVENNGIAQTTRTADTIGGSIVARGAAFGLATWTVDDSAPDFFQQVEAVVERVRTTRQPGFLVIDTMRMGPHSKGDDLRDKDEMSFIRARDPLAQLGERLRPEARAAIELDNARFMDDVRTFCDAASESKFDGIPAHVFARNVDSRPAPPVPAVSAAPITVRSSLNAALHRMLGAHPEVIVLGEDLHDPYGGAFKVTAGLTTAFPDRVISTPISEAGVVGSAIGMSLAGFKPIAEIMFADFVTLAMDQLYNHAVKLPGLSEHTRVPIVVRTPSGGRRGYGPTHSQSPESLMTAVPGLTVVFPSHRHDTGGLLEAATMCWDHPVVFFEHKLLYGVTQEQGDYAVADASVSDPGASLFPTVVSGIGDPDLTIVTYGGMLPIVEKVVTALADEELVVSVVVPSLSQPLPKETLLAILRGKRRIAIVEETPAGPGFGSELMAALLEHGYHRSVRRFAPPPVPIPAARSLEATVLPDERSLFASLVSFVSA